MASARDQMTQARELIQQKRYSEARAILVTIDHPKAREWLARLDDMMADVEFPEMAAVSAPLKIEVKQKGGPGCLKIGLGVGCVAPIAACVGIIVIVVVLAALYQASKEDATKKAIERNGGLGSFEAPIALNNWANFEKGSVRAIRLIRPADTLIKSFNMFNDDSPEGADYVLVWFELQCGEDMCRPGLLDLRLMDQQEKAWGEPWILVLDDDFDSEEALRGATIAGWQGFEFPTGEAIWTVKIEWVNETLHVEPPLSESQ